MVSVSSSPSRMDAAAPVWLRSSDPASRSSAGHQVAQQAGGDDSGLGGAFATSGTIRRNTASGGFSTSNLSSPLSSEANARRATASFHATVVLTSAKPPGYAAKLMAASCKSMLAPRTNASAGLTLTAPSATEDAVSHSASRWLMSWTVIPGKSTAIRETSCAARSRIERYCVLKNSCSSVVLSDRGVWKACRQSHV